MHNLTKSETRKATIETIATNENGTLLSKVNKSDARKPDSATNQLFRD